MQRRFIDWTTRQELLGDIELEGGPGDCIVAQVREQSVAAKGGVLPGDRLLGIARVGGTNFTPLPTPEALLPLSQDPHTLHEPIRLVFEGFARGMQGDPVKTSVKVSAANHDKASEARDSNAPARPGSSEPVFEEVAKSEIAPIPGKCTEVPAIFVGRWVKL